MANPGSSVCVEGLTRRNGAGTCIFIRLILLSAISFVLYLCFLSFGLNCWTVLELYITVNRPVFDSSLETILLLSSLVVHAGMSAYPVPYNGSETGTGGDSLREDLNVYYNVCLGA